MHLTLREYKTHIAVTLLLCLLQNYLTHKLLFIALMRHPNIFKFYPNSKHRDARRGFYKAGKGMSVHSIGEGVRAVSRLGVGVPQACWWRGLCACL